MIVDKFSLSEFSEICYSDNDIQRLFLIKEIVVSEHEKCFFACEDNYDDKQACDEFLKACTMKKMIEERLFKLYDRYFEKKFANFENVPCGTIGVTDGK